MKGSVQNFMGKLLESIYLEGQGNGKMDVIEMGCVSGSWDGTA
jgi:hypothetical protein